MINYERLREILGYDTCDGLKTGHKKWVESCLATDDHRRDDKWSRSIAVGSKNFIDNVKFLMGMMAKGRARIEAGESFQLREAQSPYIDHFGGKKSKIGVKKTYVWD